MVTLLSCTKELSPLFIICTVIANYFLVFVQDVNLIISFIIEFLIVAWARSMKKISGRKLNSPRKGPRKTTRISHPISSPN